AAIDRDAIALVFTCAPEVRGVGKRGIDHERTAVIVRAQLKRGRVVFGEQEASGDHPLLAADLLVNDGLMLAKLIAINSKNEVTAVHRDFVRTLEGEPYLLCVGVRSDDKVVLKILLLAVDDQIDTAIN